MYIVVEYLTYLRNQTTSIVYFTSYYGTIFIQKFGLNISREASYSSTLYIVISKTGTIWLPFWNNLSALYNGQRWYKLFISGIT